MSFGGKYENGKEKKAKNLVEKYNVQETIMLKLQTYTRINM
jgi:hypothetical protein